MASAIKMSPLTVGMFVLISVFGTLVISSAGLAQTATSGVMASATGDGNCAVSTARIGTADVTEFFGIRVEAPASPRISVPRRLTHRQMCPRKRSSSTTFDWR